MVFNYSWISINSLLMQLFEIKGHLIIILMGVPLVCFLVKALREKRIEKLIVSTTENLKSDVDSLIQISTFQEWINNGGKSAEVSQEMYVKGYINLHMDTCENPLCRCKQRNDLYDINQERFTNVEFDFHQDPIFVKHFTKFLYEESLNKFINSASIHVSFAFYLFSKMKNIHAAVHELKIAAKKKPTIQESFTIYRYLMIIQDRLKDDNEKNKHIFEQLVNVKEFE